MRLEDFFATVTPYLQGQASHADTARALYGPGADPSGANTGRLAIYGRLCQLRRFEILEGLYAHCARVVRERHGEEAWHALGEAYFLAHPMRSPELNANGAWLPEFLAHYAPAHGLPAWLPELADLEWWEWVVLVAPDAEPDGPRPCLDTTVDLRPYQHDLVGWMDAEPTERPDAPEPREGLVLFWRDTAGHYRRENVGPLELLVIKALHEGSALDAVAEAAGLPLETLRSTLATLTAAGVVRAD